MPSCLNLTLSKVEQDNRLRGKVLERYHGNDEHLSHQSSTRDGFTYSRSDAVDTDTDSLSAKLGRQKLIELDRGRFAGIVDELSALGSLGDAANRADVDDAGMEVLGGLVLRVGRVGSY